jgi:hypothetical protein
MLQTLDTTPHREAEHDEREIVGQADQSTPARTGAGPAGG